MTNLPTLPKNSDYYELFSERENRKQVTKLLKTMKVCIIFEYIRSLFVNQSDGDCNIIQVNSKWDRSEQVNITTKEFLFECFKLTVW